jgi:glycosyltransferase involved in cell wall biosynthesis
MEIIVVDDRSSDNSVAVVESYIQKDARIRLLKNEVNHGLVGNWNKCLELATGKWIKFVFQDDVLYPGCLAEMLAVSGSSKMVVCEREYIFDDHVSSETRNYYQGSVLHLKDLLNVRASRLITADEVSRLAAENIALNFIAEPTSVMFSKELISEIGVFDKELSQICDLEYWLRIATSHGLVYIPTQLTAFRVHGNSTTASNAASRPKFRPRYIDPLILAYKLLRDDHFSGFRKYAAAKLKKLDLYLDIKIYEAAKAAQGSDTDKKMFEEVLLCYPQLRSKAKGSLLSRLIYSLVLIRRKLKQ